MAAVMGHDDILRVVLNHMNERQRNGFELAGHISYRDLNQTIRETISLRQSSTLKVLIELHKLWIFWEGAQPREEAFHRWLEYAVELGNAKVIPLILDSNYPAFEDKIDWGGIFRLGDGDVVGSLVRKFPQVLGASRMVWGITRFTVCWACILHEAILHGTPDVLAALIREGAPVDGVPGSARARIRRRPLHFAIESLNVPAIEVLLQFNATIVQNNRYPRQDTLVVAAHTGNRGIFHMIWDEAVRRAALAGVPGPVLTFQQAVGRWPVSQ
jgi:hypothetical protein